MLYLGRSIFSEDFFVVEVNQGKTIISQSFSTLMVKLNDCNFKNSFEI